MYHHSSQQYLTMMMIKKKQKTAAAELPLPEDIMVDIVARLPVKSILRFKSVSREWGAMVTAPHFITSHLRHATFNNRAVVSAAAPAASSCRKGATGGGTLRGRRRSSSRDSVSAEYDGGDVVHRSFHEDGNDQYHLPRDFSSY